MTPYLKDVADTGFQILYGERLLNICVGPHIHAFHLRVIIRLRRQHYKRYMTGEGIMPNLPAKLSSIHTRHHPVGDNDANLVFVEQVECLDTVAGSDNLIFVMEVTAEEANHILGVIDNEHFFS